MTKPMTEERLAELRKFRDTIRRWDAAVGAPATQADRDFADAVDEIDRLREENERLKADVGVAESALFEKLERSRLRAENERLKQEHAALNAGLERALAFLSAARKGPPDDLELAQCRCSAGDQCSCAYDCDCRERYEHVFEADVTYGCEGWRNTGNSNPETACDGCGVGPTSTHDVDGNHLCRDCGRALMESES